jgi:uncharacterized membrane protein YdjX (TVP38/TMEM64 family)
MRTAPGLVLSAIGVLAAAALVLAVDPLRDIVSAAVQGDPERLRERLDGLGAWGAVVLVGAMLAHAVIFFPSEIVNAAAGFAFGFWPALVLAMVGWTASGVLAYALGRAAGRPLLHRLAGPERFVRAERMVAAGGISALLAVRLVPLIPFSLVGYVAGATRVPLWRYTWTSAVGVLPITVTVVYLGHRLESLSLEDPRLWLAAAVLLALLLPARALGRRMRGASKATPPPA